MYKLIVHAWFPSGIEKLTPVRPSKNNCLFSVTWWKVRGLGKTFYLKKKKEKNTFQSHVFSKWMQYYVVTPEKKSILFI